MLQPIKHILDAQRIVLASTSPRRREILSSVGLNFEVCPSLYDEKILNHKNYPNIADFVIDTAFHKVMEVSTRLQSETNPPDLIIGADTVVSLDGEVFGKPENEVGACQMLKRLSGRAHTVHTGVVLVYKGKPHKFSDYTSVFFAPLTEETINKYVESGEPLDKAGSYGIQGLGGSLVEKIEGDFYTVMGLPLHQLCRHVCHLYADASDS